METRRLRARTNVSSTENIVSIGNVGNIGNIVSMGNIVSIGRPDKLGNTENIEKIGSVEHKCCCSYYAGRNHETDPHLISTSLPPLPGRNESVQPGLERTGSFARFGAYRCLRVYYCCVQRSTLLSTGSQALYRPKWFALQM